jgi:ribosomal protein S18 acetylase RimI-like enzyme
MIQCADLSDAKEVAIVHVRSWQEAYRGIMPDKLLDALSIESSTSAWGKNLLDEAQTTTLYTENSEVIGFCNFGMSRDSDALESDGEIRAIYILKEYWSNGIGSKLILNCFEVLKSLGFSSVRVWVLDSNERAIQFYQNSGFNLVGKSKIGEHSGFMLREILMAKDVL